MKKLLVVEDNHAIRKLVVDLFQTNGYEVIEAPDGQLGLKKALEGGYSAILLDLKLPLMDGLAVADKLHHTKPAEPNGPIIIFSNVTYPYAKQEALRRGVAAFINKDEIVPQQLFSQVEQLIQQHSTTVNNP